METGETIMIRTPLRRDYTRRWKANKKGVGKTRKKREGEKTERDGVQVKKGEEQSEGKGV